MPEISAEIEQNAALLEIIDSHKALEGALLPILHAIQQRFTYIPDTAIPLIAQQLNLSRAEVHSVTRFYSFFRSTAPGKHTLQLCRAEACQARGSRALEQAIQQRLGIGFHQTTADRAISLEPVYCLGNCAASPSIRIGDTVYGGMTIERFERLLSTLAIPVVEAQS